MFPFDSPMKTSKNQHFLSPDTHTHVKISGSKKCFFYVFKGNQTERLERNGLNSKYFMKLVKHVLTHNRLMFGTLTLKWEWNIHLDCVNHLVVGVH